VIVALLVVVQPSSAGRRRQSPAFGYEENSGPTVPLPGNAVALGVVPRARAPERLRASDQVAIPAPVCTCWRFYPDSRIIPS
jgi:hypothetical protein